MLTLVHYIAVNSLNPHKDLKRSIYFYYYHHHHFTDLEGFPGSSVSKEFTCNAGDPGLIPGLGKSAGEGIGYPLQCSWASLVARLVKNLPAKRESWV